ncbi:uncharacterized protein TNCV_2665301 [Trichonephila clavipes]|nr:uncharacterized protein TNCV_2665301 [Trichonephila clavipes]
MDVCKCMVHLRYGVTLNSSRTASPLVRLMEVEKRWEAPGHTQGVLPQNWGETELNRSITFIAGQVSQSVHLVQRIIVGRLFAG